MKCQCPDGYPKRRKVKLVPSLNESMLLTAYGWAELLVHTGECPLSDEIVWFK